MTATSHHGFHPDAESLSAFSEQALGERERALVLAHLAVCGRCREVVALASEAADAGEGIAAAPPRKAIAANAWWKQWRLVWVPTAVVAAFAAASISVYIERPDRHAANIKIAEQSPNPSATPPPAAAPKEQAKVEAPAAEPPAAAAPATPAAEPVAPARPVRPMRWTYVSASTGRSKLTTCEIPSTSIPRAARSVATRTRKRFDLKFASVRRRCAWLLLP